MNRDLFRELILEPNQYLPKWPWLTAPAYLRLTDWDGDPVLVRSDQIAMAGLEETEKGENTWLYSESARGMQSITAVRETVDEMAHLLSLAGSRVIGLPHVAGQPPTYYRCNVCGQDHMTENPIAEEPENER